MSLEEDDYFSYSDDDPIQVTERESVSLSPDQQRKLIHVMQSLLGL